MELCPFGVLLFLLRCLLLVECCPAYWLLLYNCMNVKKVKRVTPTWKISALLNAMLSC